MGACPKCGADVAGERVCGACGERQPVAVLPFVWAAVILVAAVVFVAAIVTNVW